MEFKIGNPNGRINKPGRISGSIVLKDIYKEYKKNTKDPIKFSLYKQICALANKELSKSIINGDEVRLPCKLGIMRIIKYNRKMYKNNTTKWVDWKTSKEHNCWVYYKDLFVYKWKWSKTSVSLKWKSMYRFRTTRTNNRAIASAHKNLKMDYFK